MFKVEDIHAYFNAEKKESLLFIILGITAIVAAVLCYTVGKTNMYKGMAIPFLVIGILHGIVGYTVYSRSDTQRKDVAYGFGIAGNKAPEGEIPRMQKVMKDFKTYRYTEIFLASLGIGLIFYAYKNTDKQFWLGLGIALAIEALVSLGADYFAETRGGKYLKGLEQSLTHPTQSLNPNIK
jgi:uncharacterized membrane protein